MYSESGLVNLKRRWKRRLKASAGLDHSIDARITIEKVRLGTIYGGWWVATGPLAMVEQPIVFSFGIGQDISFDREMIRRFKASVFAFDPTPLSLEWLAKQPDLPTAFRPYAYGLSDFDGDLNFGLPSKPGWDDFSVLRAVGETVTCPVKRLSTICLELGVDHVDVLKLDIEGSEYPVVRDLLRSDLRPTQILVEYHYATKAEVAATRASIAALENAGYAIFDVSPWGRELSMVRESAI